MRFQKLMLVTILKAQAPVDPNSEDPRTMGAAAAPALTHDEVREI